MNSRIIFSKNDLSAAKKCVDAWMKVSNGHHTEVPETIIDVINEKLSKEKTQYAINMNFHQLMLFANIVAEDYLQVGNVNREEAYSICSCIEKVIHTNYKVQGIGLLYPTYNWKNFEGKWRECK